MARRILRIGSALALASVVGGLFAACGASTPRFEDATRLEQGRWFYERRCALCHELRDPAEHEFAAMKAQLDRYGARAGLRPEERELVLDYLAAASGR